MVNLTNAELPNGCWGVLSGTKLQMTLYWPLMNESRSPFYYRVSLGEYQKVKDEMSRKNEQLIARFTLTRKRELFRLILTVSTIQIKLL
ncbi:hypothetical protein [Alkalibacillus haloalkaliphilus]|uniref:hypothetical protein n=1 Tax=Alkalibacillus haloalkaliphilus TaxID=94136 RepID=UPI0012FE7B64|nr:hypothetical protein [Alkalibacillus haloalkaliphilus]